MKKVFLKLGFWIRCFFIKKSEKQIETEKISNDSKVNDNQNDLKEENKLISKIEVEKNGLKFFTTKDKLLCISTGEIFKLTEKQLLFYNIIKKLQELYGFASSKSILTSFLSIKYKNLSDEEYFNILVKSNQKLSIHNKTLKGMFKVGLLEKVSRNQYRVKI
jgi:hypothetical protein